MLQAFGKFVVLWLRHDIAKTKLIWPFYRNPRLTPEESSSYLSAVSEFEINWDLYVSAEVERRYAGSNVDLTEETRASVTASFQTMYLDSGEQARKSVKQTWYKAYSSWKSVWRRKTDHLWMKVTVHGFLLRELIEKFEVRLSEIIPSFIFHDRQAKDKLLQAASGEGGKNSVVFPNSMQ